jgi:hypothetical protein
MKRYTLALDLKNDPALITEYEYWHQAENGWPELDRANLEAGPVATLVFEDLDADPSACRATMTLALPESMADHEAREWLAKGIGGGWRMTLERLSLPG